MKCLIISSQDTPKLPSEASEIVNILGAAGYEISLLQYKVDSLELFRKTGNSYVLVWVMGHCGNEGFLFGEEVLSSQELGLFLQAVDAKELILNSCSSIRHVEIISHICPELSTLATITDVTDINSWQTALYLARAIAKYNSVEEAIEHVSAGASNYKWIPRKKGIMVRDSNLNITVDKLVQALAGNDFTHEPGLISTMQSLEDKLDMYIRSDAEWKRNTEIRIKQLEDSTFAFSKLQSIFLLVLVLCITGLLTYLALR